MKHYVPLTDLGTFALYNSRNSQSHDHINKHSVGAQTTCHLSKQNEGRIDGEKECQKKKQVIIHPAQITKASLHTSDLILFFTSHLRARHIL